MQVAGGFGCIRRSTMKQKLLASALVLSAIFPAALIAADTWPNPLIGEWRSTMQSDGYPVATDTIFFADGTFSASNAIPPSRQTGTGSGMLYGRGYWRMTGPNSIEITYAEVKICPAGAGCMPSPAGLPHAVLTFQMNGPNQMTDGAGLISYRVH